MTCARRERCWRSWKRILWGKLQLECYSQLPIIFLIEIHKLNFWFTFEHVAGLVNSVFFCGGSIAFACFRFPSGCQAGPQIEYLFFSHIDDIWCPTRHLWLVKFLGFGPHWKPIWTIAPICIFYPADLLSFFWGTIASKNFEKKPSAALWAFFSVGGPESRIRMEQIHQSNCIFSLFFRIQYRIDCIGVEVFDQAEKSAGASLF